MNINWNDIRRDQFPALEKTVHLKAAGGSPMCKSAYQEGVKYFNNIHKFGDKFWDDYFIKMDEARKLVAEYINSNRHEIAFLTNSSSGMNAIAHLINKGDILYPEGEFPTSVHIFKSLGFNCKKIPSQTNNSYQVEEFQRQIDMNTKYLIHSHVQYLMGFRQDLNDLGKICQKFGLINIINATQSFGACPLNVKKQNIDMLVASGLKWACGGYGIGILYIKDKLLSNNNLPFSSWLSVNNAFSMDNDNLNIIRKTSSMDGFGGTPNFPTIFALKGCLTLIKEIGKGSIRNGIIEIFKRIISLTTEFIEQIQGLDLNIITPLDLNHRSGIITIESVKAERIFNELLKNKIYISLRNYPKLAKKTLLRFSFNYYNNSEDIEKTITILKRCS